MSHHFVYQIRKSPIPQDEYIDEDSVWSDLVIEANADGIEELSDEERAAAIQELERFTKMPIENDCFIINGQSKVDILMRYYTHLQDCLRKAQQITLHEFINDESYIGIEIRNAFSDKWGDLFYNEENYGQLDTEQNFLRGTKPGDRWYVGAVFDYRY